MLTFLNDKSSPKEEKEAKEGKLSNETKPGLVADSAIIDLDCVRTQFNFYPQETLAAEQDRLNRLLKAYFHCHLESRYYQGMNEILGAIARTWSSEAEGLAIFEGLVNNHLW